MPDDPKQRPLPSDTPRATPGRQRPVHVIDMPAEVQPQGDEQAGGGAPENAFTRMMRSRVHRLGTLLDNVKEPWKRGMVSLAAALAGGLVVVGQGLTVGLFGGYHTGFHLLNFLLHVVVLGPAVVFLFFWLAEWASLSEGFQVDAAAAMVGTALILMATQLLGGLRSSNLTLLKFAVTAYGTYAVIFTLANRRHLFFDQSNRARRS